MKLDNVKKALFNYCVAASASGYDETENETLRIAHMEAHTDLLAELFSGEEIEDGAEWRVINGTQLGERIGVQVDGLRLQLGRAQIEEMRNMVAAIMRGVAAQARRDAAIAAQLKR